MRRLISPWLIIWQALFVLVILSLLWAWGEVRLYEHNAILLGVETAAALAILVFGIWSLIRAVKG